jgi:hypothetical protein
VNVWADLYRESDVARALEAEREERRSTRALALLGLLPSGLACAGAWLALVDLARGRRRALWPASLLLSAATLGSFGLFAWRPIWSALRPLLWNLFPSRSSCRASSSSTRRRRAAAFSAGLAASRWPRRGRVGGLVLPRRAMRATGAVRFYFGEYERRGRLPAADRQRRLQCRGSTTWRRSPWPSTARRSTLAPYGARADA